MSMFVPSKAIGTASTMKKNEDNVRTGGPGT